MHIVVHRFLKFELSSYLILAFIGFEGAHWVPWMGPVALFLLSFEAS